MRQIFFAVPRKPAGVLYSKRAIFLGRTRLAAAALAADVAIHGHFFAATAGVESALTGTPTLMLDREGFSTSPLYKLSLGRVIFKNWDDLWKACQDHWNAPQGMPGFGDWSSVINDIDPFRDGRAAERMGTYLEWIMEGFKAKLPRETILADAAERYSEMWGKDKVFSINCDSKQYASGKLKVDPWENRKSYIKKPSKLSPEEHSFYQNAPRCFCRRNGLLIIKKAKGVEIWDLDDKHYYDMSIMGVGACVLGYANDEINKAVIAAISDGNMTTLNCYEEIQLARKLIELHPWAQMVRYAKTGGEACTIAVRIARAFSRKRQGCFLWLPWMG